MFGLLLASIEADRQFNDNHAWFYFGWSVGVVTAGIVFLFVAIIKPRWFCCEEKDKHE